MSTWLWNNSARNSDRACGLTKFAAGPGKRKAEDR